MTKNKSYFILFSIVLVVCAFAAGYFWRGQSAPKEATTPSESVEESKAVENTTSEDTIKEEKVTLPARSVLSGVDLIEVRYNKEKNTLVAKLETHVFSGMDQLMAEGKINSMYATMVSAQIKKRDQHEAYPLTTESENFQMNMALGKPFEITFVNPHKDFPMDELYEFDLTFDFAPTVEKPMPDRYSFVISLLNTTGEERFIEESLRTKEDQSHQDNSSQDK